MDEPRHQQVHWLKNISLFNYRMDGQTNQPMSELLKNLSLPTYTVDERTKAPINTSLPINGVDGKTKPLMGALVKKYKSSN